jgi:hypothetical protein
MRRDQNSASVDTTYLREMCFKDGKRIGHVGLELGPELKEGDDVIVDDLCIRMTPVVSRQLGPAERGCASCLLTGPISIR